MRLLLSRLRILLLAVMLLQIPYSLDALAAVNTTSVKATTDISIPSFSSEDEAALYIRQKMKDRSRRFSVKVVLGQESSEEEARSLSVRLFNKATYYTGVATEGDYLRFHLEDTKTYIEYQDTAEGSVYQLKYVITYRSTLAEERQVDTQIQKIQAQLNLKGLTKYEKICKIYKYVKGHVAYDDKGVTGIKAYTAYGALVNQLAVCQGYGMLLYRLLLENGIDCRFIYGTGNGSDHGWNIVRLGNVYYDLDATWDSGNDIDRYFMKCNQNFGNHIPHPDYDQSAFWNMHPMAIEDYVPVEHKEHVFERYVSNHDATCTADGTMTAVCEYCEATDTIKDPGSMKNHQADVGIHTVIKNATYLETGMDLITYHCQGCNLELSSERAVLPIKTLKRPSRIYVKNIASRKAQIKWRRVADATGYQIGITLETKERFVNINDPRTVSKVISRLKKGKIYSIRIRSCREEKGQVIWSIWTKKYRVKIKV